MVFVRPVRFWMAGRQVRILSTTGDFLNLTNSKLQPLASGRRLNTPFNVCGVWR
jgi:hypothetical protein